MQTTHFISDTPCHAVLVRVGPLPKYPLMGNICAALCVCQMCCRSSGGGEEARAKTEPGSRVPYVILFLVIAALSVLVRYWQGLSINLFITSLKLCDSTRCVGYGAVFRLTFALALLYGLQSLVCKVSSQPRSADRDFWCPRIIGLILLIFACWFIPNDFYEVYSHFARTAGAIYLFLQIVVLIDAVIRFQEMLIEREMKAAILGISLACLGGSLTLLIFLFKWFGGSGCGLENFFISFTIVLTLVFLLLSVSNLSRHGIMPAAVMCLYCYYVCYSALSSSERMSCNRIGSTEVTQVIIGMILTILSVTYSAYSLATGFEEKKSADVPLAPEDAEAGRNSDDNASEGSDKIVVPPATTQIEVRVLKRSGLSSFISVSHIANFFSLLLRPQPLAVEFFFVSTSS